MAPVFLVLKCFKYILSKFNRFGHNFITNKWKYNFTYVDTM